MSDQTPLAGPSPLDGLSRLELKTAALCWLDKAKQKHREARIWQNRALLAESQLAALKAAYEPAKPVQGDR
jgi:hypothetical protein